LPLRPLVGVQGASQAAIRRSPLVALRVRVFHHQRLHRRMEARRVHLDVLVHEGSPVSADGIGSSQSLTIVRSCGWYTPDSATFHRCDVICTRLAGKYAAASTAAARVSNEAHWPDRSPSR